jgi:hypothetical protein
MLSHRVVHVRGTPASGKSVLVELLQHHLKEKQQTQHLKITMVPFWPEKMTQTESTAFIESTLGCTLSFLRHHAQDRVLLLDEGQSSYYDKMLWNTLIKSVSMNVAGVYMVILSCYGAPGKIPVNMRDLTPMVFDKCQRVGLSWDEDSGGATQAGLLLKIQESAEICERLCGTVSPPLSFPLELKNWLHELTDGHVGALVSVVFMIRTNEVRSRCRRFTFLEAHTAIGPQKVAHVEEHCFPECSRHLRRSSERYAGLCGESLQPNVLAWLTP